LSKIVDNKFELVIHWLS